MNDSSPPVFTRSENPPIKTSFTDTETSKAILIEDGMVQPLQIPPRKDGRKPMVCLQEVATLSGRYGTPTHAHYSIKADDYIYSYRWRKEVDRRAEVVFAIEDPTGKIWVHAKPHYPAHIFRLPSGGIHLTESVEDALLREVQEETGIPAKIQRFLGVIEYTFYRGNSAAKFASYVFHLYSDGDVPICHECDEISEFRALLPSQLSQLAVEMRNLIGDRHGWGQWRALAHDLVYEYLCR